MVTPNSQRRRYRQRKRYRKSMGLLGAATAAATWSLGVGDALLLFPNPTDRYRSQSQTANHPSTHVTISCQLAASSTTIEDAATKARGSISNDYSSSFSHILDGMVAASSSTSLSSLLDPIVDHPSLQSLELHRRPRRKLKPRHKALFRRKAVKNNDTPSEPSSLLERLACACCDSGVVPRKEFFETYASASLIHHAFPTIRRVADLAAGHGLLSWMLLAMDEYQLDGTPKSQHDGDSNQNTSSKSRRSAICVDRRMPPSAVAIAKSMRKHLFPVESEDDGCAVTVGNSPKESGNDDDTGLYDWRWTYVETDLGNVVVGDASTLLVSVHACGTLSDYLIDLAISATSTSGAAAAPLALVPCCHTYSIQKGYAPHPIYSRTTAEQVGSRIAGLQQTVGGGNTDPATTTVSSASHANSSNKSTKTHAKFRIIEDVIDEVRLTTLQNAGYQNIRIASLPKDFTERNRLFLVGGGSGKRDNMKAKDDDKAKLSAIPVATTGSTIRKGSMPPSPVKTTAPTTANDANDVTSFSVPLGDTPESIRACLSVSGKAHAIRRLRQLIPNHFAPKLDVSMWLTTATENEQEPLPPPTLETLQRVLDETIASHIRSSSTTTSSTHKEDYGCTIAPLNEVFVHPQTKRVAGTYQIEYSYKGNSAEPFPKKLAKELHQSFCKNVVASINGTEVR